MSLSKDCTAALLAFRYPSLTINISLLDHAHEVPLANIKRKCQTWPEKHLILGRSGTKYVTMVTKLLSLYCEAHLVDSYCKESNISDTNWLRCLPLSYFIKIFGSVDDIITWLICIF